MRKGILTATEPGKVEILKLNQDGTLHKGNYMMK